MTPGGFSCTPQNPKIHHFSSLPLGVQENRNTISVRSASSILLGLDREFKQLFRFSFVVLLCLRSCGTAQVTSQTQPDLRACVHSELPKSPVMTTAALRPVNWSSRVCCQLVTPPLWSTHRSLVVSLTILWFLLLRLAPAPFGLGCVSLCVLLCRSVSRRTTVTRTPDNTGRSHDHSLVGAADRSLAPCAVIPRDDNQSFAVWTCWWLANSGSRVRFPGYLPLRASSCSAASTGQLARLPLRASFLFGPLSSSTGLVPSLQFYGVGALSPPVLRGWCPLSPVLRGWCPPVLGLAPSSSRVGALQFSGWSPGSRSICLPVRSESS